MDRAHWRSPAFGNSPRRPRFPGRGGGGYGSPSPRHFSPHGGGHGPSPYRFQGQGSPYSSPHRAPYYDSSPNFHTSTPVHHSGRPYFRGGGGRHKRPSFGSPFANKSNSDDIENWISPEMWADPWAEFTNSQHNPKSISSSFLATPSRTSSEIQTSTKFAESDFDVSDSVASSSEIEKDKSLMLENSEVSQEVGAARAMNATKSFDSEIDIDDEDECCA